MLAPPGGAGKGELERAKAEGLCRNFAVRQAPRLPTRRRPDASLTFASPNRYNHARAQVHVPPVPLYGTHHSKAVRRRTAAQAQSMSV